MRTRYLEGIALFMICLIVGIPIYSASVFATLSNIRIYGGDGIRKIARAGGTINITVSAKIKKGSNYEIINPSEVCIPDRLGECFDSCFEKGDGFYECSKSLSVIGSGEKELEITLYKDNGNTDSIVRERYYVDSLGPTIEYFSISPSPVSNKNITIRYRIKDHAYAPGDDICSGLDRIELISGNKIVSRELDVSGCIAEGSIILNASDLAEEDGITEVSLVAYDKLGNYNGKTTSFVYDTTGPEIDVDSLEIRDSSGNIIDYVGNNPVIGSILFRVNSDSLSGVYADVSSLNVDDSGANNNRAVDCEAVGADEYGCRIDNVEIKLNESKNVRIIVEARDMAGNVVEETLTGSIDYDNIGPYVNSISSSRKYNGTNYVNRMKNNFIVEFIEDGAGISKQNIELDLSQIKTGLHKKPDSCNKSGNLWTCYWYNISCDKSGGAASVSVSGTDKVGNEITGNNTKIFVIDNTVPVVVNSSVRGIGVGSEAFSGYIKTGDVIMATLTIREETGIGAYADFSNFVSIQGNVSGSCDRNNDLWECNFQSNQIDIPGHIIDDIYFYIIDSAGNIANYKKEIEVLWNDNATGVNYWSSSVECSPNLIDREASSLVSTRVYCAVRLSPNTADQEVLSIGLGSCVDNYNNSLNFIDNIALLNGGRGSTEPYLAIDLIKGAMATDKISIVCPLSIISRVGGKITAVPEREPVLVDLYFYNMPLGEYGDNIKEKIKDAKDEAFYTAWKVVGFLESLLRWAKMGCVVLNGLYKLKLVYMWFTSEITGAEIASIGTPVEPIIGPIRFSTCLSDAKLQDLAKRQYIMADKLCKFVNCQMSPPTPDTGMGGGGNGWFKTISDSILNGAWIGDYNKFMDWNVPLKGHKISEVFGKQYSQYANARDNLLVALVVGCIPGIIAGVNKYRQILCLYADCLEQNAYNNVPIKVCEDQKNYAICKYILGEIFAVLPWTALFDYYFGLIKDALSDPLSAIGLVASYLCKPTCVDGKVWLFEEKWCNVLVFLNIAGELINDVTGIIDSFKQGKNDYCDRISEEKDKKEDKK